MTAWMRSRRRSCLGREVTRRFGWRGSLDRVRNERGIRNYGGKDRGGAGWYLLWYDFQRGVVRVMYS